MQGLTNKQAKILLKDYGPNSLGDDNPKNKLLLALISKFKNPLVIILLVAAVASFYFGDKTSSIIIFSIVLISIVLDFANTFRSEKAADDLKSKVKTKVCVVRDNEEHHINAELLVPGDIVKLSAGKVIPADGRIIDSDDLYCNESNLTGESFPQIKQPESDVYMGSGVVSGSGYMRVTLTSLRTKFAHIVIDLRSNETSSEFDNEIKKFSFLIIKITFALVIFVFIINAIFHHNFLEALLFSLALAVGLTPELLPLIITMNLTKGSLEMAKNGVIVKQLSAIQNLGSMDVLCTDKTGTLTENRIALVKYVNGNGKTDESVLQLGYLISHFSTSFENPLDNAIREYRHPDIHSFQKIDEIPFDFDRKREAVVVHHIHQNKRTLLVKGAPEEIFAITSGLTAEKARTVKKTYEQLSRDGYRVLAVASKTIHPEKKYEPSDENHVHFEGFLAFLDPAKPSVHETLTRMEELGVEIKIITGDNLLVTEKIMKEIGLTITGAITGDYIDGLDDSELSKIVNKTNVFSRVNPEQKLRVIQALQNSNHVVGYMGDGINDAPSLHSADVAISVNNAVDVAKDAADFILLKKSLNELTNGIIDGRKTFANTMKYLKMSLSSNFGNMFSMAGASIILPFLPMLATQILLNNLLYDTSQFAIPFDNVDNTDISKPHKLEIKNLKRFMWSFGLLSSIFDFLTFAVLIFIFKAAQPTFQAGWFLESMLTQILVIYIIRSRKPALYASKPAPILAISTILVAIIAVCVVTSGLGSIFKFSILNIKTVSILFILVFVYLFCAEILKNHLFKKQILSD